jgi:hypothetical protein
MLVNVRPSNEVLLRARVPGALNQCGGGSFQFFHRARSASRKGTWPLPIYSLPVRPPPIDDDLMDHGILAESRQIHRRFCHVEWVDLLAAENFYR